jgi:hypothetical protein
MRAGGDSLRVSRLISEARLAIEQLDRILHARLIYQMAVMVTAPGGARTRCTAAAEIKVVKYGNHFPETPLFRLRSRLTDASARRSTGFLAFALDGPPSFGQEVSLRSVPLASRLIGYYRSRVSISL